MLTPDLQQLTEVRPQLEQSLMAQAWTVAGDVLWAIERRNFDDLASSWRRLCRLRGVDFSAEPLPNSYGGPPYWHERIERDVWDRLSKAISAALRNAEAPDGLNHWRAAHEALQSVLMAQARYHGTNAILNITVDALNRGLTGFSAYQATKAAHYARLAIGGGQ